MSQAALQQSRPAFNSPTAFNAAGLPLTRLADSWTNQAVKIFDFPFPIEIGSVCDVDFFPDGTPLTIQGSASRQFIFAGTEKIEMPSDWSCPDFPIIRWLSNGRFLIVDTSFDASRRKNAWILLPNGEIETHFEIGSAAVEITALWGMFAVAYHPLSAKTLGHQIQPMQRAAIAFYDLNGRILMGFNQEVARHGLSVSNVRCMTGASRSQLVFVPETAVLQGSEVENPVIRFDCATGRPTIYSAPLPRAEAISIEKDVIHLASPEGWEDQIITFDAETKISQHRGEFLGVFRGLEGGAFLSQLTTADYAVIMPGPQEFVAPVGLSRSLEGSEGLAPV